MRREATEGRVRETPKTTADVAHHVGPRLAALLREVAAESSLNEADVTLDLSATPRMVRRAHVVDDVVLLAVLREVGLEARTTVETDLEGTLVRVAPAPECEDGGGCRKVVHRDG
jgi:hypothetical protein